MRALRKSFSRLSVVWQSQRRAPSPGRTSMPVPKHFGQVESSLERGGGGCESDASPALLTIRSCFDFDFSGALIVCGLDYSIASAVGLSCCNYKMLFIRLEFRLQAAK